MINRLKDLTEGRILVDDRDIMAMDRIELRRGIGYVMQTSGLFPHRRIRDNIATVPRLLGWDRARIDRRVEELVELVGLMPELLDRYPHALSGGQQQRVGVARALAADPPILLMDEPFAAVDPIVRARLQDELVRLQRRLHKTIVFVTHDIDEAIGIGDRIAVLREPGQVAQYASPTEMLAAPADDFVRDFLGHERELRRLALVRVDAVAPEEAPVVTAGRLRGDGARGGRALRARLGAGARRRATPAGVDGHRPPRWRHRRRRAGRALQVHRDRRRLAALGAQRDRRLRPRRGATGRRGGPLRGPRDPGQPQPDAGMNLFRWSWIVGNTDVILDKLVQHVQLTGLALLFGLCIAFPLALAAIRWPRLYGPALGTTGVAFTIPSLALFILLIPFTGLSIWTSLIGLTIYTLLILFRNIVAGFNGVPRDVREAARAMGYTRARQLFTVRAAGRAAGDHRRHPRGHGDHHRAGHGDRADRPGRARPAVHHRLHAALPDAAAGGLRALRAARGDRGPGPGRRGAHPHPVAPWP
ncbi:MAG: ATP-binding cassette domain-containing protein [Halofilum sp. (in: g-proteobacteria)]|nr:ATP-binding cassette domain-containing protein [Halofilum sp. (in: g-proteobacteria)]